MEKVNVELGERGYTVHIGPHLLRDVGKFIKDIISSKKACILSNPAIWDIYAETITNSLANAGLEVDNILIPEGERHKNLGTISKIYDRLIDLKMDRYSLLIAVGGGIVGDMGGFAAATYLRGIPYLQIPTTLLAQVDSSVGGKTGVNHLKGKNLIGAFYQPKGVIIDTETLKTLPPREFLAGLAEIIKYGIIEDSDFFEYIEKNIEKLIKQDIQVLTYCIKRSCEIKSSVVSKDERESGFRAILNFGHTFGHAIESVTAYNVYLHGEALAIGMVMAARLSADTGLCKTRDTERVVSLIRKSGLPVSSSGLKIQDVLDRMSIDKKTKEGKIRFVLIKGTVGKVEIRTEIETKTIKRVIEEAVATGTRL